MPEEERIPCGNSGCTNTMQPITSERTKGMCMPCFNRMQFNAKEEEIRRNRRDVNEFTGVIDPVEIIKIARKLRKIDRLINWIPYQKPTDQLFFELSEAEGKRLADFAIEQLNRDEIEYAQNLLAPLACFTDVDLGDCQRALAKREIFLPSFVFRNAPEDVRDALIKLLDEDGHQGTLLANHVLLALAWIGDDTVVATFKRWEQNPRSWRSELHIGPGRYAHEAGWELTDNWKRRDLFYTTCTSLKKGLSEVPYFQAVSAAAGTCQWCNSPIIDLFKLNPIDLGISNHSSPINVPTCDLCLPFGVISGSKSENGTTVWSPKNLRPSYLPRDVSNFRHLPQNCLAAGVRRGYRCAVSWTLPTTYSQVGGLPMWVDDAEYPVCLECKTTMKFLAQLAREEVESGEGFYYAFWCEMCGSTATHYQQS